MTVTEKVSELWPCQMCDTQLMDELLKYMGNHYMDAANNYLKIRALAVEMRNRCAKRINGD